MGLMDKIRSIDLDDALSYQTIKMVVIRDRRLGAIHYLLQLAIFIYIIGYTIVYQQRYLKAEPPYGTIRATAKQPNTWGDVATLPYCTQNQSAYNGYINNQCVYLLGTDTTYPPGLIDSVMITTRVKDSTFVKSSANCSNLPSTPACAPNITNNATASRYYTAGVEDFTVYMEHSIFGRENKIILSNVQCNGELRFKNKKTKPLNFTNPSRGGDIVTVRTLLEAAGVDSLDVPSLTTGNISLRYDGTLLVTIVDYQNDVKDSSKFSYYYQIFHIPGVDVIAMQPSSVQPDGVTIVQRNYYGVRMIFIVVGSIGYFDFPTLLQALVAAAVLLKVATTVVDLLILHFLPDRETYRSHKFERTEDFSDMRNARKQDNL